jgi:flagellar biosynthetic protein FliO
MMPSIPFLLAQSQTEPWVLPDPVGGSIRGLVAVLVVMAVMAVAAWVFRRGMPRWTGARQSSSVQIETAVSLGDRRSLVVVSVEGQRLLLGVTPSQVTLVTGLHDTSGSFDAALERRMKPREDSA